MREGRLVQLVTGYVCGAKSTKHAEFGVG